MMNKTKIALGFASATVAIAGVLVAPQAVANSKAEKVAIAMDRKVEAMELQIQQMANMMEAMQSELTQVQTQATGNSSEGRFMELENWMASVKNTPVQVRSKDNMIFFRGGWVKNNNSRDGVSIRSDTIIGSGAFTGTGNGGKGDDSGWYLGAGFDFSLSDNLWGFMDGTEVLAELQVLYKDLGTTHSNILGASKNLNSRLVSVTSLTVSASPKIKFMKGSKFRPWIIPIGFSVNVISPPSESITVIKPGMVFAAGADYNLWEDIYLGIDGRYNQVADHDGVDMDGFEVGAYLGIGF
jgi:opacity protein-like surface antigen